MQSVKVRMVDGGRVIVPAAFRKVMGVEVGDTLTMTMAEDGGVQLLSPRTALRRLQQRARALPRRDLSVVDELIAERRAEAARE